MRSEFHFMDDLSISEDERNEIDRCIRFLTLSFSQAANQARSNGFSEDHISSAFIGLAEHYRADVAIRLLTSDDFSVN